jgi:hypothetical protein
MLTNIFLHVSNVAHHDPWKYISCYHGPIPKTFFHICNQQKCRVPPSYLSNIYSIMVYTSLPFSLSQGLQRFGIYYTFLYFFWTCSTFSNINLCTFAINYILNTICFATISRHTYSSHISHNPLRLLSMVNLDVHPVSTIKVKYSMLA